MRFWKNHPVGKLKWLFSCCKYLLQPRSWQVDLCRTVECVRLAKSSSHHSRQLQFKRFQRNGVSPLNVMSSIAVTFTKLILCATWFNDVSRWCLTEIHEWRHSRQCLIICYRLIAAWLMRPYEGLRCSVPQLPMTCRLCAGQRGFSNCTGKHFSINTVVVGSKQKPASDRSISDCFHCEDFSCIG